MVMSGSGIAGSSPAGTYPGQERKTSNTITQPNCLAARADVDEEAVCQMQKKLL